MYSDHHRLPQKQVLIPRVLQGQSRRFVDHTADVQAVFIFVDERYAAMVAHEMVFVPGEGGPDETTLGVSISYSSI